MSIFHISRINTTNVKASLQADFGLRRVAQESSMQPDVIDVVTTLNLVNYAAKLKISR